MFQLETPNSTSTLHILDLNCSPYTSIPLSFYGNSTSDQLLSVCPTIQPPTKTDFGNWGVTEYCPVGSYVDGANLLAERNQGNGDDTSVNAVRLYCKKGNRHVKHITSSYGPWGDWRGFRHCTSGFVQAARIRSEPNLGEGKSLADKQFDKIRKKQGRIQS